MKAAARMQMSQNVALTPQLLQAIRLLQLSAIDLEQEMARFDLAELEAALRRVQTVEPSGFGARNLHECLLLQLDALPAGIAGRNLAERLRAAACRSPVGRSQNTAKP